MDDLFLRACRGEPVPRPPVWIMRQAGRYLPEYRRVRERVDFLTLCRTPELAAEVTLQPLDVLGVDAAILFADILLPLEAMGVELRFDAGAGPVIPHPVRDASDLARLRPAAVEDELAFVFDALREVRRRIAERPPERQVPVIGFAGAPWSLAAYLVEGGTSKSFAHLRGWAYRDPEGMLRLLDLLADVTVAYLRAQIDAGAQALQVFDTWGGLLDRETWRRIARPALLTVLEALQSARPHVPLIYFCRGGGHLLPELARLPVDVLSVDWTLPLDEVRRIVGPGLVLQGNLDPAALLGDEASIRRAVARMIEAGRGGGHVANLGHGILPMTPVENARAFVDAVRQASITPAR
jgi:uroporphyrinogen decarboxylase